MEQFNIVLQTVSHKSSSLGIIQSWNYPVLESWLTFNVISSFFFSSFFSFFLSVILFLMTRDKKFLLFKGRDLSVIKRQKCDGNFFSLKCLLSFFSISFFHCSCFSLFSHFSLWKEWGRNKDRLFKWKKRGSKLRKFLLFLIYKTKEF